MVRKTLRQEMAEPIWALKVSASRVDSYVPQSSPLRAGEEQRVYKIAAELIDCGRATIRDVEEVLRQYRCAGAWRELLKKYPVS